MVAAQWEVLAAQKTKNNDQKDPKSYQSQEEDRLSWNTDPILADCFEALANSVEGTVPPILSCDGP